MCLIPNNWHTFQHYNKRNPPWIKLHRSLLDNFEFQSLPVDSRALAPMLWLIASETDSGEINLAIKALAFRVHLSEDALSNALKPLICNGFFVDASDMLADCLQHATPEREAERETESEVEGESERDGKPSAKVAKAKKPKGRDYGIAALGIMDEVMTQAERVWNGWPKDGWNFSTKKPAPRRINRALFLERFQEILTHSPIRKADDSRISAEDLANSALEFVMVRIAEGRRDGSEIPNVPCVANFFSSCENEKNPWKDALLAYFGG